MVKSKSKRSFNKDILGILLITIGILVIFSVFSPSSLGLFGKVVRRLLIFIIGLGAYIIPYFIIFIGICYITKKGKISYNKKFYGIVMIFVTTLLLLQLSFMSDTNSFSNFGAGIKFINESNSILHGGVISYLIDIPLHKLFGFIGCYLIFSSSYVIAFILISQVQLYDIFKNIKFKSIQSKETKKKVPAEEAADITEEKKDYIKNINSKIKIIDFMKTYNDNASGIDHNSSNDKPVKSEAYNAKSENAEIKNAIEISKKNGEKKEDPVEKEFKSVEKEIEKNSSVLDLEYAFPNVDLLNLNNLSKLNKEDKRDLINNANKLEETLDSFGVEAKVVQVTKGPSVTRFELQPNAGVKVSKIVSLSDDIALNLASSGVRIEAPIPGKSVVGIEVPNKELTPVYLREVLESIEFIREGRNLSFCLGKDIGGNCVVSDLTKMPHVLIAGATGSGKSVCINTLIISLLYKYSPEEVKLLMIDPKMVELNVYNGIPHLLIPVVTDPKKAAGALNWAVNEMVKRYKLFADNGVRNIESYNELVHKGKVIEKLPWIVIIVDELADLMMVCPNDIEDYIGRLAQMARAAGMHLVIATQRPSVDVITGVIKANIPSRISFAVSSQIDSRTILDTAGAEKLLGRGDMLFYPVGESKPMRVQGAFISEDEVEKVVTFIKNQGNEPEYESEILDHIEGDSSEDQNDRDELLDEAIKIVVNAGQASTSLLQRRLRIGYNRAARLIEELEQIGVISGRDGSKPRQILVDKDIEM